MSEVIQQKKVRQLQPGDWYASDSSGGQKAERVLAVEHSGRGRYLVHTESRRRIFVDGSEWVTVTTDDLPETESPEIVSLRDAFASEHWSGAERRQLIGHHARALSFDLDATVSNVGAIYGLLYAEGQTGTLTIEALEIRAAAVALVDRVAAFRNRIAASPGLDAVAAP